MKVEIQETDLAYVVQLIAPKRKLGRAVLKSQVDRAVDPRAFLAAELQSMFVEWKILDLLPSDTKDRLIREFFAA